MLEVPEKWSSSTKSVAVVKPTINVTLESQLRRNNAIKRSNANETWSNNRVGPHEALKTPLLSENGKHRLLRRNAFRKSEISVSLNLGFVQYDTPTALEFQNDHLPNPRRFSDVGQRHNELTENVSGQVINFNKPLKPSIINLLNGTVINENLLDELEAKLVGLPIKICDFNNEMRMDSVQWLIATHDFYGMEQDILFYAVAALDNFTTERADRNLVVDLPTLVTCMLIVACKNTPGIMEQGQLAIPLRCTFKITQVDLTDLEFEIMESLLPLVFRPLSKPIHFLRRYARAAKLSRVQCHLADFLLELSLLNERLCRCRPSLLASSAVSLATKLTGELQMESGQVTSVFYSEHSEIEELEIIQDLFAMLRQVNSSINSVLRAKYASEERASISTSPFVHASVLLSVFSKLFPDL